MSDYLTAPPPAETLARPLPTPRVRSNTRLFWAALLSALVPGVGHFLVGRWRKALVFLVAFAILFLLYRSLRLPHTLAGLCFTFAAFVGLSILATWDAAYAGKSLEDKPTQWWLALLLPVALLAGIEYGNWGMLTLGFRAFLVPSRSMAPSIPEGSHAMVDTWYFRHATPRHGEVIVCMSPISPGVFIIKRVIAVGGDTIEIRGDTVLVNGSRINEPYALFDGPLSDEIRHTAPISLPAGTMFLLGDNRHLSLDSRMAEFGLVDVSAVRGKVLYSFGLNSNIRKFD